MGSSLAEVRGASSSAFASFRWCLRAATRDRQVLVELDEAPRRLGEDLPAAFDDRAAAVLEPLHEIARAAVSRGIDHVQAAVDPPHARPERLAEHSAERLTGLESGEKDFPLL